MTQLSDFCEIIKGNSSATKTPKGKYPLVVTAEERKTSNSFQFDTKGICVPLISSTGHGHASIKRIHYQEGKFALANILVSIIPDEKKCIPKFLYYLLSHKKDYLLVPLMHGSANMSMRPDDIKGVKINLPNISKQRQVVTLIGKIDEIILKNQLIIDTANSLNNSIFHKLFGDPIKNSKNWDTYPMAKIAQIERNGIQPSKIKKGTKYVGLEHIQKQTGLILDHIKTENGLIKSSKFVFTTNHILYGKLRPYLNKVAISNFDGVCSTDILPILVNENFLKKEFLCSLLRQKSFVDYTSKRAKGANLPRIKPEELEKFSTIAPPMELQTKFSNEFEKCKNLVDSSKENFRMTKKLYHSLLHEAFD